MKGRRLITLRCAIVIYKSKKGKKRMSNGLEPWENKTLRSKGKIESLSKINWGESEKK
jgi:hypothetical protein